MPSASSVTVSRTTQDKGKPVKDQPIDVTEPFKQVVTLIEHKIRNMEKRKMKLDAYKQEQEQGKELNPDQLLAVAKYGELMQSLEFARDLSKSVTQIQGETNRLFKKQQKKEQADRVLAEAERRKEFLILSNWLHRFATLPIMREDFVHGRNGAKALSESEIEALNELVACHEGDLAVATEHFTNLIDGKSKPIPKTSTTYSHMKEILISINNSGYVYDPESKAKAASSLPSESKEVLVSGKDCAKTLIQETPYHLQEEREPDVQSSISNMDPAIVAVSTSAPPQLFTQQIATMQQVIPHASQKTATDADAKEPGQIYRNNSIEDAEVPQGHNNTQQQQRYTAGETGQQQNVESNQEQQVWESKKSDKYGGNYNRGANNDVVLAMENNDFMENNFSTWESEEGTGGSSNRVFRRGGGGGNRNSNHNRYSSNASNGYHSRGNGNHRYGNSTNAGSGNMNRWSGNGSQQGVTEQQSFDEYRGGRQHGGGGDQSSGGNADYKPRGASRGSRGSGNSSGTERNYYNSGSRNGGGAPRGGPRGGSGGRRPYRGGGGGDQSEVDVYS